MSSINDSIQFPDYFITSEDIICHTLSQLCIVADQVVGFPKYFPLRKTSKGIDYKTINGKKYYNHLTSFYHSLDMMREICPKYLKYLPHFGEELCVFDLERDIKKLYSPKATAQSIYSSNYTEKIFEDTKLLINLLIKELGISIEEIGVEGSIMLGGFKEESDIDMIIYGQSAANKLKKGFKSLSKYNEIHLYDEADIPLILSRRGKYRSFDSNIELLRQEQRRSVGLINGRRFRAQPVLGNKDIEDKFKGRSLVGVDIVEDYFDVIDGNYSYLWPSFYKLHSSSWGEIDLECYDPIYMNQCDVGDKVYLRGKLYKDLNTGVKTIIMGPWIFTHQYIRNTLFIV